MIGRGIALMLVMFPAIGMAGPVVPDRPGFGTGTYTVPPGAWQFEAGIQNSYGKSVGDPDSYTAPLFNLRTGLTETTEFNLLWDGVQVVKGQGRDVAYAMLGAKHRLTESDLYNLSLLGYLSVQEGRLAPFLGLLWDRQLTEGTGLYGTLQFATSVESGERKTNFQPTIGVNFTHTGALGTFIEVYSDMPLDGGRAASVFDAGIAWLPRENLQLDFNFGISLDGHSGDFIGIGVAMRY